MALRGGYGISYERNFGNVTYNAIQNPPNYGVCRLIAGELMFLLCRSTTDNFGPLGGTGTKALRPVSQRDVNQNIKTAYAETSTLRLRTSVGQASCFRRLCRIARRITCTRIANVNPATWFSVPGRCQANRINYQYSNDELPQ